MANSIINNSGLYVIKYKQEGDLAHEYNPLHNILDETSNTADLSSIKDFKVSNEELGLDLNNPVDIECQPSYDGTVNLIINDDKNPPRLINSRFSVTEDNRYKIINRNQLEQTNLYKEQKVDQQTRLFRNIDKIPIISLKGVNYYGQLKGGNYTFYIKLSDGDYNETDIVAESSIISIFHGTITTVESIYGALAEELTDKTINLRISNIDTSFSKLFLYYTRTTSDTNGIRYSKAYKISKPYDITETVMNISINGFEEVEEIDEEKLNVKYNLVTAVKTQAQVQNMLFFGNTQGIILNHKDLQNVSLYISVSVGQDKDDSIGYIDQNYTVKAGDTVNQNEYYNPLNIYYKLGYWPDEIYRLGIVYIMADDSLSPVYNLRGCKFSKIGDWNKEDTEIFNEDEYLPNNNDFLNSELSNVKGVFRMPDESIQDDNGTYPLYFKIKLQNEVLKFLKKNKVKGYFIVRQKRIPITLAQGYSIGVDNTSYVPMIYYEETENEGAYYNESFISNTSYQLTTSYEDRKITTQQKETSGLLCLDACVNPVLQSNFNGSKYSLLKRKKVTLKASQRYYYQSEATDASNKVPTESGVLFIPDDNPLKFLNNFGFSTRAGSAESVMQFGFFGTKDYNKNNNKLVRGIYTPFLGLDTNLDDSYIYDIKISNYSSIFEEDYFKIRMNDNSAFYAVTDRYEIPTNITEEEKLHNVYRGDCFTNTITFRLHRNFIDTDVPVNETIVNPSTWIDHYKGFTTTTKEDYGNINRADVNTVPIGTWITIKVLSNYNLGLRSKNSLNTEEIALMGNARSFYPNQSRNVFSSGKIAESYILNDGYNSTVSIKRNIIVPDVPYIKELFDTRIMFSDVQVDDGFRNAYRIFQGLDYKDLDRQYGAIVKLLPLGVNLFCVFEHGIGIIPINEKALMATNTGQSIHMYGAEVIQNQITLISPDYGSNWKESVIRTPNGIYGVDTYAKKIWRYSDKGLELLSDFKVQRFLNDNINLKEKEKYPVIGFRNVKSHYNNYKGDVMFTFYNNDHTWHLCYNEKIEQWVTEYSWTPLYSENINNIYYSLDRERAKLYGIIFNNKFGLVGLHSENSVWEMNTTTVGETAFAVLSDLKNTFNSTLSLVGYNFYTLCEYEVNKVITSRLDEQGNEIFKEITSLDDLKSIISGTVKNDKLYLNPGTKAGLTATLEINKDIMYNNDALIYNYLILDLTLHPYGTATEDNNSQIIAGGTINQKFALVVDYKNLNEIDRAAYDKHLKNGFYVHGRAGIFDEIDYFDEDEENQILPCKWYNKQEPFEFEFVVNNLVGMHKIFDNLVIISNNVQPKSFEFEIIGDVYDFNKAGLYRSKAFNNSNLEWNTKNNPLRPLNVPNENKTFQKSQQFQNISIDFDPILNQYSLIIDQEAKNIVEYGRMKGNIHYKEDAWYLVIEPIKYKEKYKERSSTNPIVSDKYSSTRIRDKFLKVRIKYSGEDLAIITALKTLMTLSYS